MTDNDAPMLGTQEGSAVINSGGDPHWQARGAEFDRRNAAAADVRDKITINGKPFVEGQPIAAPEAQPVPAEPAGPTTDASKAIASFAPALDVNDWTPAEDALRSLASDCPASADLVREWGSDGVPNMNFTRATMSMALTGFSAEGEAILREALSKLPGPDYAALYRNQARMGRLMASVAGDVSSVGFPTSSKGGQQMAEYSFAGNRTELETKHAELTEAYHNAWDRGDRSKAQRIFAERTALSKVLWPGENRPEGAR